MHILLECIVAVYSHDLNGWDHTTQWQLARHMHLEEKHVSMRKLIRPIDSFRSDDDEIHDISICLNVIDMPSAEWVANHE